MKNIQITGWCSRFIEEQVQEGDLCIDATAGNGSDTLLLSRALKKSDSKKELGFFSYFHYNRNIRRERLPC